jgi:hypothetical protein
LAATIVDATGFVNSGRLLRGALKPLEKAGNIREISRMPTLIRWPLRASTRNHQICALPEIWL